MAYLNVHQIEGVTMKILLSTIGSRGDVQPILALALELQRLGHKALICAAPNFQEWVKSFGVDFAPIGFDLEKWTRSQAKLPKPMQVPSVEERRKLASMTVIEQFRVLTQAAQGCDLIVVGGVLQTAGRSVAEALKIPYVYVSYCPTTLPSPDHPPAMMGTHHSQSLPGDKNLKLWEENNQSFNQMFLDTVNEQRAALGLSPVQDVSRYVSTDEPWLAADPVLGPAGSPIDMNIIQTGAWLLNDPAPLPEQLEKFLEEGEPPLYFGFGSMRASEQTSGVLVEVARALGKRAIISQGWAQLNAPDVGSNCMVIGNVDHAKLFPRVALVAHHGGAGTTTTTACAGKPQVIVPHVYDQYYWADRVQTLGIGVMGPQSSELNVDALVHALRECLKPEMTACAQTVASRVERHGVHIAAERLIKVFG
jgi:vancomycin aglycone glucosyltransferase